MLTRRNVLRAGAAAGVLSTVPASLVIGGRSGVARAAESPFRVPLKVRTPLRPTRLAGHDFYRLTTREADVTLLPGTRTRIRSFNGVMSPLIVARRGRPVVIEQINSLNVPFSMHLHGGHVPGGSDGHPENEVKPGGKRIFRYPNQQRASTLWIHDHSHHSHAENIYRGLAATYVLTDDFEDRLPLPKGRYDVPLQLRDAKFGENGALDWDLHDFEGRHTLLVNGSPRPYFEVAARKYRLRLVNTSNERLFLLQLGDGEEFTHIGTDGGLLPAPVPTRTLQLWPGERHEIVVDFGRYAVGRKLVLNNTYPYEGEAPEVMRFDVVRTAPDPSSVPATLRSVPDLGTSAVEREFTLSFNARTGEHLINNKPFDTDRVDIRPRLNVTETWRITNADTQFGIPHSLHPHLDAFRILDRNGEPPAAGEAGLKDTITVMAGESARVQLRFTDYTGRFMYHCHMLGHLQMGMMGQMEIGR
ncbi:multicopper oxidase domain-containing protein [Streptomyces sp. NBC_01795]|uniref:multicopper oxidase family protein n=1 Tax=unclassified Streptomyces TaxID=2593676 RepID=UPI002DDB896D|nr:MULTISPECIES: multicopper oxidase domain-containing protein [unclassified Streptomyces]WSA95474.1 multicopper oxidase domain-containing protein [Streptomyces sp. NBC_01795]WSB79890.1 multicopper oxidase domain-containing protein [Streptomyces sp. NBC_01775]